MVAVSVQEIRGKELIRKYSDFLHLLMSVSESTGFSFFKQKLSAT